MLWSDLYIKYKSKASCEYKFSECSSQQSQELEVLTRGQSECNLWIEKRKTILSASKLGKVVKRRKDINEAFLRNLYPTRCNKTYITGNSESTLHFMQMGLDNEDTATSKYLQVRKDFSCVNCGLLVNPGVPCLGASPDRVVLDKGENLVGLLKIKTLTCKQMQVSEYCIECRSCWKRNGKLFNM